MDVVPTTGFPSQFRIKNPVLRYRLDPCEPGMLRSAPASQSTAAVSAHERGNLTQFRREAALAGRMVVYSSITFTRGIDGLFPSVRAGRTEVVTVPMPDNSSEIAVVDTPQSDKPAPVTGKSEIALTNEELELLAALSSINRRLALELPQEPALKAGPVISSELPSPERLDFTSPSEDLGKLEGPFILDEEREAGTEQVNIFQDRESSPVTEDDKKPELGRIELPLTKEEIRYQQEMREIRDKLNELMLKRMSANIAQLNEVITGVIRQNIDLVAVLVQVANRLAPDSHFGDLSGNVALLGSTLDFRV